MLYTKRRCVLMVSTYYAPEQSGSGPYATQLAESWAAAGAEVHVLAGMPHYPAWRTHPDYVGSWRTAEVRNGVLVHRRRHLVPTRHTTVQRALYEASILFHGIGSPPRTRKPDVVVAEMPTLAGGVLAARIARRRGAPFVPIVQDLMGAAAVQSGIKGGERAATLVSAVESKAIRHASLVGVIHESMIEPVTRMGIDPGRIRLVPNWSHIALPSQPRHEIRRKLGWGRDEAVLLHAGNMGLKQRLDVLIDLAELAPDVRVVLLGDGNQREYLQALAGDAPNVDFLPPVSEEDFPELLAAADVLALTQRASVADMSVPSKLTSYFAAARPVLASAAENSGGAAEVQHSGAGVVVSPEDPIAMLKALRDVLDDPARAAEMGRNGVKYVNERLGKAAGIARVTSLLSEALEMDGPVAHVS